MNLQLDLQTHACGDSTLFPFLPQSLIYFKYIRFALNSVVYLFAAHADVPLPSDRNYTMEIILSYVLYEH